MSTDLGSLYNPGEDVRCPSDDSFLIGNDEVVASATAVASPGPSTLAQQDMNSVLSTPPREDLDEEDEPDTPPTLATEPPATANDAPKMTLGKKTLAGIVISSGPGGHFETYEGTNDAQPRKTDNAGGVNLGVDSLLLLPSTTSAFNPRSLLKRPPLCMSAFSHTQEAATTHHVVDRNVGDFDHADQGGQTFGPGGR